MATLRQCRACGDPVSGHRDKICCDSSCKSRYCRRHPEEPAPVVLLADEPRPTPIPVPAQQKEDEDGDWRTQHQRAADEQKRAAQRQELQRLYCRQVDRFLAYANRQLPLRPLTRLIRNLERALGDYQAYPDLAQAEGVSMCRLKDLYWMRATLRGAVEDINQQSILQGLFGNKTSAYLVCKKKQARLLDHFVDRTD